MPGSSPTAQDLNQWLYFTLKGVTSPGTIARDGIKGFNRQTGWDKQRGKGTQGATLILKDAPPAEGSITLQLIGPGGFYADGSRTIDFDIWDAFVETVLSIAPAQQKASGLQIFHPSLASVGVTAVVVEDYSPLRYVGKGLYLAEIKLIEWTLPPKVSIVSQVQSTAPDVPDTQVPPPQDPRITALEQQIALLNQAGSNP